MAVLLFASIATRPLLAFAPPDPPQAVNWPAGGHPVRIDLHVFVDGVPIATAHRAAWDAYVAALFKHMDRDGDGSLSEAEAKSAPPPPAFVVSGAKTGNIAYNFSVVDANSDGRVSQAELAAFYREYADGPFGDQPKGVASGEAASDLLFKLADADSDGRLSPSELATIADRAILRDGDGDELISPVELGMNVQNPPAASPTVSTADSGDAPAAFMLTFHLGKRPAGVPVLSASTTTGRLSVAGEVARLEANGERLEIRALREDVAAATAAHAAAFRNRYQDLDLSGKGRLSRANAEADRGFLPLFSLLDRDGDGTATAAELQHYLDAVQPAQARAALLRAVLRTGPRSRGLFGLLDHDRDGKLSRRELRNAATVLAPFAGADGFITRESLPDSRVWAIGLGDPDGGTAFAGLPQWGSGAAPAWFRKTDRNRDGEVSPREFLGTTEQFRKLDADGDGLISLDEALKAGR